MNTSSKVTESKLPEPTLADRDLLQIAAWLDGRLDEPHAADIELLLANDRDLLERTLALRELHTEPVAAAELLRAQQLVTAAPYRPSLREQIAAWLTPPQGWHAAPVAAGAMMTVLVMAGSLWFGTLASQELGADDLQTASLLEITRLDFSVEDGEAIE